MMSDAHFRTCRERYEENKTLDTHRFLREALERLDLAPVPEETT